MQTGSCHCGAVKFTADVRVDQAMECNCSHCSRKGFLHSFIPMEAFAITAGDDKLTTYTFNKHAIQHQFCSVCGCQPFGLGSKPDGTKVAAINVRCIDGVDLASVKRVQVNGRDI